VYAAGPGHLLEALGDLAPLRRVLLVGSTAVWPPADVRDPDAWIDETAPARPGDFRGEAILRAAALLFHRLPGRAIALRLAGIYGPGRAYLIDGLRAGGIVAPEDSGHWSNRIHVEDAAAACLHLLNLAEGGSCYIGTDGHPVDRGLFYDSLSDLPGVPRPRCKPMSPTGKRLSNARLLASGWSPRWPDAPEGYRALLENRTGA
jgi:nucleoside-diphosphate-sugar epimerase